MQNNLINEDGSKLNFLTPPKVDPIPLEPAELGFFGVSCLRKLRRSLRLLANEEGQMELLRVQALFGDLHLTNPIFVRLPRTWLPHNAEFYQ